MRCQLSFYQMAVDVQTFLKVLASVSALTGIGGFIGGRFIKRLDYNDERKRLRRALYAELGANIQTVLLYQLDLGKRARGIPGRVPPIDNWVHKEVYNEGLTKRPVMFRDLKEAKVLDDFYFALERAIQQGTDEQQRDSLSNLTAFLRGVTKDGVLSRRQMYKVVGRLNHDYEPALYQWIRGKYHRLTWRNVNPKTGRGFLPAPRIRGKAKALWTGVPGKPLPIGAISAPSPPPSAPQTPDPPPH
jgi:hypothetical protein